MSTETREPSKRRKTRSMQDPRQDWLEENCVFRSDPTTKWERLEEEDEEGVPYNDDSRRPTLVRVYACMPRRLRADDCKHDHIIADNCKTGHLRADACEHHHIIAYYCKPHHIRADACEHHHIIAYDCKPHHIRADDCKPRHI